MYLYVDDILFIGRNNELIRTTKRLLNSKFDMKDMSFADVILSIKITRTSSGIVLSQSHYVEKILEKFGKSNTSVSRTPVDVSLHLTKNNGDSVSQLEYSWVIGSLMLASLVDAQVI